MLQYQNKWHTLVTSLKKQTVPLWSVGRRKIQISVKTKVIYNDYFCIGCTLGHFVYYMLIVLSLNQGFITFLNKIKNKYSNMFWKILKCNIQHVTIISKFMLHVDKLVRFLNGLLKIRASELWPGLAHNLVLAKTYRRTDSQVVKQLTIKLSYFPSLIKWYVFYVHTLQRTNDKAHW